MEAHLKAKNISPEDTFTRLQIVQYLEHIPLGYSTEREHAFAETLIETIQKHFSMLKTEWEDTSDY